MFKTKLTKILEYFQECQNAEDTYQKLIELSKQKEVYDINFENSEHLVPGCQSKLYLYSELKENKVYFKFSSDALISAGLAQLLVWYYSGEDAQTIIQTEPKFLEELKISTSLTPSRANGLYSIHLKMKQEALKHFMSQAQQIL